MEKETIQNKEKKFRILRAVSAQRWKKYQRVPEDCLRDHGTEF